MRPCGRLVAPPSVAYPAIAMLGRPLASRFWFASTTPGTPGNSDAALNPRSCTEKFVTLREKPARVSTRKVGEKVCVSVSARFCEPGVLLVPLVGRLLALSVLPPNQM